MELRARIIGWSWLLLDFLDVFFVDFVKGHLKEDLFV